MTAPSAPAASPAPRLMTKRAAAEYFRVSPRTIGRWIAEGVFMTVRTATCVLVVIEGRHEGRQE